MLVSSDYIVNFHVIENVNEIKITTNDNKAFVAEIIGGDENSDIAVLKISGNNSFPYINLQTLIKQKLENGFKLFNPFNLTSTAGIIVLNPEI